MKRSFLRRHAFLLLFLLAAVLRLLFIWRAPLWYDENYTLLVTRLPFDRMIQAVIGDVHPPLFYLLLWPLGQLHAAPAWIIRLPSALFSIAALWLWWEVLKGLGVKRPIRWMAWGLMAISSTQLFYAQEGRMYALLTFLVMAGTLALLRRKWLWLGLACLAMLYTHNYGIFYAACLWISGMLLDRRTWRPLTLAIAVAFALWLPWLPVLLIQIHTIQPAYWIIPPTPGGVLYDLYQSFFLHAQLRTDIWNMAVFFGWLAFAVFWAILKRRAIEPLIRWEFLPLRPLRTFEPILVMAFGTFVMAVAVSLVVTPILLYRALVPLAPFVGLFLALPFARISRTMRSSLLAAVLIVPVLLLNAARMFVPSQAQKAADDYRVLQVIKYVEAHWQPGDIVYHLGDGSYVNMTPYAADPAAHVKMPPCAPTRGELSPRTRQALGEQTVGLADLAGRRVWFFTNESPMTPQCEEDFARAVVGDLPPVVCIRDDDLVYECLYLLEK